MRGRVFDASTGKVIDGTVSTDAACGGTGCVVGGLGAATDLKAGGFAFDAYAVKPATLTLSPTTKFQIEAKGYRSVVIAHGPRSAVETDGAQTYTALPDVYLCPLRRDDVDDDSDGDGICDAAELRYGTKPTDKDSDEDGLSDSLELLGHPVGDTTTYDIGALGANPVHKDIIVAVRYIQRSQWDAGAFARVIASFKAAPRDNPDGVRGINLIVLFDDRAITGEDDLPNLDRTNYPQGQRPFLNNEAIWGSFNELEGKYFGTRPLAFHHALIANLLNADGTSGLSRGFGASDFVVTLGGFEHGTVTQQSGTFMHELGHNLGLHHGGLLQGGGVDDDSFKAQYISVMNYNYQFNEIERTTGQSFDYSRLQIGAFDEAHVNEHAPFQPAGTTTLPILATYLNPHVHVVVSNQHDFPSVEGNLAGPLDLNRNCVIETDATFNAYAGRAPTRYGAILDDWSNITFGGGPTGYVGDMHVQTVQRVVDWQTMPPCLSPATAAMVDGGGVIRSADDTPPNACPKTGAPSSTSQTSGTPTDETSADMDAGQDDPESASDDTDASGDNPFPFDASSFDDDASDDDPFPFDASSSDDATSDDADWGSDPGFDPFDGEDA